MTFSDRTINSVFVVKTTGQLGLCYQRFQGGKQKKKEKNWSLIKRNLFFNSPYNMRVLRVGYSWNVPCKQLVLWCSAHKRSVNACSIINNQRYHFSKEWDIWLLMNKQLHDPFSICFNRAKKTNTAQLFSTFFLFLLL